MILAAAHVLKAEKRAMNNKTHHARQLYQLVLPKNSIQGPSLVRRRRDTSRFVFFPAQVDITPLHHQSEWSLVTGAAAPKPGAVSPNCRTQYIRAGRAAHGL